MVKEKINKKEQKDLDRKQTLLTAYSMLCALKATHYNTEAIDDKEMEKVLKEKVTVKDVMLLVEGMQAPIEGKLGEAYHSYKLLEFMISDLAKKVYGKDTDIDKLFKKAEKDFNKEQEKLKKEREELIKKQIKSVKKEASKKKK